MSCGIKPPGGGQDQASCQLLGDEWEDDLMRGVVGVVGALVFHPKPWSLRPGGPDPNSYEVDLLPEQNSGDNG